MKFTAGVVAGAISILSSRTARAATFEPGVTVHGDEVVRVEVRKGLGPWRESAWEELDRTAIEPGEYELRFRVDAGAQGTSVAIPSCAGRARVAVDGRDARAAPGPTVLTVGPGAHDIRVAVAVNSYERRLACGDPPVVGVMGAATPTAGGFSVMTFASPWAVEGGGRAVVYVPPHHDPTKGAPLLVGLHAWNGTMWSYTAYAQLSREAAARDVVLLLPSGLGNSLYTAHAEDEVLRAMAAVAELVAVDPRAVSIWGASMGGAGATTIGLHHPDHFASVVSFFGDSKYDLATYVRSLLPDEAAAHQVNALDVVDNARHLPVWLIHGEDDRTSPIRQSELLATALRGRGFAVRFDRIPAVGHSGALVARFLADVVALAKVSRTPDPVARVTYRSVRVADQRAYGITLVRASANGDAFVDVERRDDGVHVLRVEGLRGVVLRRGALGTDVEHPPNIVDEAHAGVEARWEPR